MGRILVLWKTLAFCLSWLATGESRTEHGGYRYQPNMPTLEMLNAGITPRTRTLVDHDVPDKDHVTGPESPPGESGGPGSFIVNGIDAIATDHPYHGSLQEFDEDDQEWYHVCGASLIDDNKVLVAAHCVPYWGRRRYRVAFGWQQLSLGSFGNPGSQVFKIRELQIAPDFDPCNPQVGDLDVAVGTLHGRITETPSVSPIDVFMGDTSTLVGSTCSYVGFGVSEPGGTELSDILQTTNTTIISREMCERFWAIDPAVTINDDMVCTLDWPYRLSSVCQGDSGGGLVCDGMLVGVTSFTNAVCNGCTPDVSTTAATFTRFLRGS